MHVQDGGVTGSVGEFGEVGDSDKQMFVMGRLKVLGDGVEHGNAISGVDIVGKEPVDVFAWDDGWVEQRLVDLVAH